MRLHRRPGDASLLGDLLVAEARQRSLCRRRAHYLKTLTLRGMTCPAPRPMTVDESRVLELLLGAEFPGVEALRVQAHSAVVVGECLCGCPSIALAVPGDVPLASFEGRLAPTEGSVRAKDGGTPGEIILFVDNGRLSHLEYVYYDAPPTHWPSSDRVTVDIYAR